MAAISGLALAIAIALVTCYCRRKRRKEPPGGLSPLWEPVGQAAVGFGCAAPALLLTAVTFLTISVLALGSSLLLGLTRMNTGHCHPLPGAAQGTRSLPLPGCCPR